MSGSFLDWYTQWGQAVILWVQTFRTPILDQIQHGFTFLGDNRFFLGIIAVIFWTVNKRLAISLAFLLSFSGYINTVVKNILTMPRPTGPGIVNLESNSTYSLPSGHTQSSTSVYGRLTAEAHNPKTWALFGVVVFLIGQSRVYRAAHYPFDVVVGFVLGLAILVIFMKLQAWAEPRVVRWPLAVQVGAPLTLAVALFVALPGSSSATATGGFAGIAMGAALENRFVRMRAAGAGMAQYLGRVGLGAGGMLAILALDNVFSALQAARFEIAILTGLWIALGAPILFCTLRLAERDRTAPTQEPVTEAPAPTPTL